MKKTFLSLVFIATAAFSQITTAAPITYIINRLTPNLQGQSGFSTTTGFITTNGKLGAISFSDITSFSFQTTITTNNVANVSGLLTQLNAGVSYGGTGVIASADMLFLDGSLGSSSFGLSGNDSVSVGNGWIAFLGGTRPVFQENSSSNRTTVYGVPSSSLYIPDWRVELATTSGRLTQGAIQTANSVPLPTSALLIAIGLSAFYRRSRKTN
jgi:hypothetical protein